MGFGGYPTLPPLYAASNMGIPTLIHEQNAVMGRANKGLAGRVKAIAGGFLPENSGAYAAKTVITGNPVRPPVLVAAATPYTPAGKDDRFRLLVFGGSQGAQFFSQAIPAAVALLPEHERARLLITQQARKEDEASARQAYEKLGVPADVAPSSTICPRAWRTRILSSRAPVRLRFQKSPSSGGLPCWCRFPMRSITIRRPMQPHLRLRRAGGGGSSGRFVAATPCGDVAIGHERAGKARTTSESCKSVGKPDAARLLADLAEAIVSGKTVQEFKEGNRP